jgi:phosphatidylserine/phosphatidylglycerophosphate/cardiolipin synthase-like enzyme
MRLIIEPDAGNQPILTAIKHARRSIDLLIFRVDGHALTRFLEDAVRRGVSVNVLIAHKHRGGSKDLRKLEMRLLDVGATVSRTADDLVRYHGKMMIVDHRLLHLYGFNCTRLDLQSRSFGIVTTDSELVAEALRLFEADRTRQPFAPRSGNFVVSPENSRARLAPFIRRARKQLLVYDPRLSDEAMHRLLRERSEAGVDVRVIGHIRRLRSDLPVEGYAGRRLHVRAIVRDGNSVFVGSQSLGRVELDERRELGVIVRHAGVVRAVQRIFEGDWALAKGRARAGNDRLIA